MSWPILKYRAAKLEARKDLSANQRAVEDEKDLRFWTNFGLSVAVALGIVVVIVHCWSERSGAITTGMAAFGAALGAGGVLGFLFGVPSAKPAITTTITGPVAVSAGVGSRATNDAPPPPAPELHNAAAAAAQGAPAPVAPAKNAAADPAAPNPNAAPTAPAAGAANPAVAAATPPPVVSNLEQVADWVTKLLLGGGLTQMQRIPPLVWKWSYIISLGIAQSRTDDSAVAAQQAFAAGLLVYGFIAGFFSGYLITKLQLGKAISD